MKYLPGSVIEWSGTHQGKKMVRYTLTSGVTTAVSFSAVAGLYGFRIIPSVIWATLAGNVIGMLPAYQLNRRWTWGKKGRSLIRLEIVPFMAMSVLGIAFAQLGAWIAKDEVDTHHWSHLANTGLVAGTNLLCFAVFWVLKLIVFNRIFHVNVLEQMEEHLIVEEKTAI
jgi:putative flippase GtrA